MKSVKRPQGYVPVRSLVLRALLGTSVVGISILAPQMTRVLKALDRPAKSRKQLQQRLNQAVLRLSRAGLVTVSGEWGRRKVRLTDKGRELAEQIECEVYSLQEPALWDGKWRIVMFDVSEHRRDTRDKLRHMLQNAGFVRIQDSVWGFPYPCDEFVALLRTHLKSGSGEVRHFVAEALEADRGLREHFNL